MKVAEEGFARHDVFGNRNVVQLVIKSSHGCFYEEFVNRAGR